MTYPDDRVSTFRLTLSIETLLFVCVFLVALLLRAVELGVPPLSESEAGQAIAAWHFLTPDLPGTGIIQSPLTFAGLVLSFAIVSAGNAAARLIPMLIGTLLVFTPLLLRKRIGPIATLAAVAVLAVSPTAVALSRQVNGIGLSILAVIVAAAVYLRYLESPQRQSLSLLGAAFAIALLSDARVLLFVISLFIGLLFMFLTDEEEYFNRESVREHLQTLPWRYVLVPFAATLLALGSLFFLVPGGLNAFGDQLVALLRGFARREPLSIYVGLNMVAYEPLVLVFGILGAWLASQSEDPFRRFLAGWGIAGLFVTLIYPGTLPLHALWTVLPMTFLTGLLIEELLSSTLDDSYAPGWSGWLAGVLFIALLSMVFASLSRHLQSPRMVSFPNSDVLPELPLDLALVVLWVFLLLAAWMTFASLWGPQRAWQGAGIGVLFLGGMLALGNSAAYAFTRPTSPYEGFSRLAGQPEITLMVTTAEDISQIATGHPLDATISVEASPDGTLAWALRDFHQITYVEHIDPSVQSDMVITPADLDNPALGSAYVGQDFTIIRHWAPSNITLPDLLRWIFYRSLETPLNTQEVVLWVREDVYRLVPSSPTR